MSWRQRSCQWLVIGHVIVYGVMCPIPGLIFVEALGEENLMAGGACRLVGVILLPAQNCERTSRRAWPAEQDGRMDGRRTSYSCCVISYTR